MAEKENLYDGIKQVVYISSNISTGCDHCSERIGHEMIAESINHYIQEHGYKLLHVGTETTHGDEGPWHSTVAVLGSVREIAKKKVEVTINFKS